jgi:hypothetical protein
MISLQIKADIGYEPGGKVQKNVRIVDVMLHQADDSKRSTIIIIIYRT